MSYNGDMWPEIIGVFVQMVKVRLDVDLRKNSVLAPILPLVMCLQLYFVSVSTHMTVQWNMGV